MKTNVVIHGDCLDVLRTMPDNCVDSVVTDPPYGLSKEPDIEEVLTKWMAGEDYKHRGSGFMGKSWDSFVPGPSIWREVHRVLKPGGHALVFAGTRTQDLMAISLRLAGFEIRDVIAWLYFNGFPKSLNVSKALDKMAGAEREVIGISTSGVSNTSNSLWVQEVGSGIFSGKAKVYKITAPATDLAKKWDGWGTTLKPAHEPIIVARKPLIGTVAENVERWGTGAINIDGCRIGDDEIKTHGGGGVTGDAYNWSKTNRQQQNTVHKGRFPANIVTTESDAFWSEYCDVTAKTGNVTPKHLSKKASKKDRNSDWLGREIGLPERTTGYGNLHNSNGFERFDTKNRNNHPTVKPTDLMAWLCRLVTPPDGIVLDPFAGSGSTLVAAKREGFKYIGIEQEAEYVEIAEARLVD